VITATEQALVARLVTGDTIRLTPSNAARVEVSDGQSATYGSAPDWALSQAPRRVR